MNFYRRLRRAARLVLIGDAPAASPAGIEHASGSASAVELVRKATPEGHPNVNPLWSAVKDAEAVRMNVKLWGSEQARQLQQARRAPPLPVQTGLTGKCATQADIESEWLAHWCARLGEAPHYHRKVWEFAFVLQALFEAGVLRAGLRALVLDTGHEPLSRLVSDIGMRVERAEGAARADAGFDACWSTRVVNGRGSIAKAVEFIEASLPALRPGGLAVHTFDYNFEPGEETLDDWPVVLLRRSDIEAMAARLRSRGHDVAPLNFDLGTGVLDRFVDVPPYAAGEGLFDSRWADAPPAHLKLSIDGFACTSYGVIVKKAGG